MTAKAVVLQLVIKKHAKMYSLQTKLNVSFIVRWETVVFVVGRVYSFSTSLQKS